MIIDTGIHYKDNTDDPQLPIFINSGSLDTGTMIMDTWIHY